MKLFSYFYKKCMVWSRHRHAPYYLAGISFSEASFFIVPPDVMLAPMSLARPERAWFFALLTTLSSVLGGIFGYCLGLFFFYLVHPLIIHFGYENTYLHVKAWFEHLGFYAVFFAGFSPIPYKIFTLTAGTMHMPFLPFVIASLIGRGTRFFLVATLMRRGGERMEALLHKYIDRVAWFAILLLFLAYAAYKLYAFLQ